VEALQEFALVQVSSAGQEAAGETDLVVQGLQGAFLVVVMVAVVELVRCGTVIACTPPLAL
jgi:hypothetical protein